MIKGFKNFLLRGDVVVIAVGLVIALAFSTLVTAFTTNIINPIVARFQGNNSRSGSASTWAGTQRHVPELRRR